LREKLVKIGAEVVGHAKYVTFQLAEVAVPLQLFGMILERIGRLRLTCGSGCGSLHWTKGPERCRRASAVRRSGGFQGLSEAKESCASDLGGDGTPAAQGLHCLVLSPPPKPDTIIQIMNKRAESGQEGERLGYTRGHFPPGAGACLPLNPFF